MATKKSTLSVDESIEKDSFETEVQEPDASPLVNEEEKTLEIDGVKVQATPVIPELPLPDEEEEELPEELEAVEEPVESDDPLDEILRMVTAYKSKKRSYSGMTKKERRTEYKSARVVALPGETVSTEMDEKRAEAQELMIASKSNPVKIEHGYITGSGETENGIHYVNVQLAGYKGYFPVKIPSYQLFMYNSKDYLGPNGNIYMSNELVSRHKAKISFVVKVFDEKTGLAYGDRLEALAIEARLRFIRAQKDGVPAICNGMIIQGRVVGVRRDRIRIDLGGCDCTLHSEDLSWRALGLLTEEFHVNDLINVKIDNIKTYNYQVDGTGPVYRLITANASKKNAEDNPAELYYDQFKIGDVVSGTVKAITESGIFVSLNDKMDSLCSIPVHGTPVRGMDCSVRITSKIDESKRIYGQIVTLG